MIAGDTWETLAQILSRDPEELQRWEGRSFRREVGLDSLELFELITRVETMFDVELPEDLIAEVDNLEDVVACIRSIEANY